MHKFWAIAVGCALSVGMGVAQENSEKLDVEMKLLAGRESSLASSTTGAGSAQKERAFDLGETIQSSVDREGSVLLYDDRLSTVLEAPAGTTWSSAAKPDFGFSGISESEYPIVNDFSKQDELVPEFVLAPLATQAGDLVVLDNTGATGITVSDFSEGG